MSCGQYDISVVSRSKNTLFVEWMECSYEVSLKIPFPIRAEGGVTADRGHDSHESNCSPVSLDDSEEDVTM